MKFGWRLFLLKMFLLCLFVISRSMSFSYLFCTVILHAKHTQEFPRLVLVQQNKRNATPGLFDKGNRTAVVHCGYCFFGGETLQWCFSLLFHWWIFHLIIVFKATKTPEDASDCRLWIRSGLRDQGKNWLTLQVADNEFHGEGYNVVTGMMGRHPSQRSSQGFLSLETSYGNITLSSFSNHVRWLKILRNNYWVSERNCLFFLWMKHLCDHLVDVIRR